MQNRRFHGSRAGTEGQLAASVADPHVTLLPEPSPLLLMGAGLAMLIMVRLSQNCDR